MVTRFGFQIPSLSIAGHWSGKSCPKINVLAEYYLKLQSGLFQGYAEITFPGHLSGNLDYMGYSCPENFLLSLMKIKYTDLFSWATFFLHQPPST